MADLNANAGNMSADEYLAAFNDIITDLGVDIEKELKDVDAEGAGKEAGEAYGKGFSETFGELVKSGISKELASPMAAFGFSDMDALNWINKTSQRSGKDWASSLFNIEGHEYELMWDTSGNRSDFNLYVDGVKAITYDSVKVHPHIEDMFAKAGFDAPEKGSADWHNMIAAYLDSVDDAIASVELYGGLTAEEHRAEAIKIQMKAEVEIEPILDPYLTWGSPQHMVSKFQEYRDTIEPELIANVYAMENNLREEGKAGWEQAWADILDPSSTELQIETALEVLQLDEYGLELVDRIRRGMDFSGVWVNFSDEMEKIAQEGADVFSDNFVGEDEAQTMIDRLTWAMTQDPAAFEEAGGKTALQYWEGLQTELDKLDAMITAEADPSQIADQRALIAQIIGDHPYQIQVEAEVNAFGGPLAVGPLDEDGNPITLASLLFGTDADRRREIERDDLWWRNEVMPQMEDHIDKMLAAATSGYADDYEAAKENAKLLYQVQDTYADMMTARQNQLISDLRSGQIGIMEFNELWDNVETSVDDVGKSVDELSDKYGNLAKTTAEAGDDCCEAMSAFGKAQEAASDMFFESYIGPTENYAPWLAETGEYDKRISVGFDFPDDIDQQVAEYLNAHPVDAEIETSLKEGTIENDVILPIEEAEATIIPGADLNQDDLYNIVTEINTTETAIPVGLNADAFWNEYMSIVTKISSWRVYIPVDVDVVANIPALASQIKAEILAGLQS